MAILMNKETLLKQKVELSLEGMQLKVSAKEKVYSVDLSSASVKHGGAGNRYIFIESTRLVNQSLYFEKKSELAKLILSIKEPVNIREKKKIEREDKTVLYGALFLLLMLGLVIFNIKTLSQKAGLALVSVKTEQKIAEKVNGTLVPERKRVYSKEIQNELDRLTSHILSDKELNDKNFKFFIVNDSTPNAFATFGGHIFINTGLFKITTDTEEVLGVLAHEIAHVTERHVIKNIFSSVGIFGLAQLLIGDFSGIIAVVLSQGEGLLRLSNSREAETQADKIAYKRLVKYKVNPKGLIEFFTKLNKESSLSSKVPTILKTHPGTEERIKALQEKLKKDKINYTDVNYNILVLKELINKKVML